MVLKYIVFQSTTNRRLPCIAKGEYPLRKAIVLVLVLISCSPVYVQPPLAVVHFTPLIVGNTISGCVSTNSDPLKAIRKAPQVYYINVPLHRVPRWCAPRLAWGLGVSTAQRSSIALKGVLQ